MAEEIETGKSNGSGFGRLVFGVVAGNGYNTDGMSFEQAFKIFKKLGGENNWKAKELSKKAEEDRERANRKINAKGEADKIAKNHNSSDFEKKLYEGVKEDINKEGKNSIEEKRLKQEAQYSENPDRTNKLNRAKKLEEESENAIDGVTKEGKPIVNGYVIGKTYNGDYIVYDNLGYYNEDKNKGYTYQEAIERAKSLEKGQAVPDDDQEVLRISKELDKGKVATTKNEAVALMYMDNKNPNFYFEVSKTEDGYTIKSTRKDAEPEKESTKENKTKAIEEGRQIYDKMKRYYGNDLSKEELTNELIYDDRLSDVAEKYGMDKSELVKQITEESSKEKKSRDYDVISTDEDGNLIYLTNEQAEDLKDNEEYKNQVEATRKKLEEMNKNQKISEGEKPFDLDDNDPTTDIPNMSREQLESEYKNLRKSLKTMDKEKRKEAEGIYYDAMNIAADAEDYEDEATNERDTQKKKELQQYAKQLRNESEKKFAKVPKEIIRYMAVRNYLGK